MVTIVVAAFATMVLTVLALRIAIAESAAQRCERCQERTELLADTWEHCGSGWMVGLRLYACPSCGEVHSQHYTAAWLCSSG